MTKTVVIISASVVGAAAIGVGVWLLIKKLRKKKHKKTESKSEVIISEEPEAEVHEEQVQEESDKEWDTYVSYASMYSPSEQNRAAKDSLTNYIFGEKDETVKEIEAQYPEAAGTPSVEILAHSEELAQALAGDMNTAMNEQYPLDDDDIYEEQFYDEGNYIDDEDPTEAEEYYTPEEEAEMVAPYIDHDKYAALVTINDSGRPRLLGMERLTTEEYVNALQVMDVHEFRVKNPNTNLTDEQILDEVRRYNMSNQVYDGGKMSDAEIDALLTPNNSKKKSSRPLIEIVDESEWDKYYNDHINDLDVLNCDFYCKDQILLIYNPMKQQYEEVEDPFDSLGGHVISYLTRHPDETVFVKDREACNMWEIKTVDDAWDY